MPGPFKLYPEERHWWSFNDYGAVLDVMTMYKPKRVVEFGPGSSTLALIEGGAESITMLEDNPDWAGVYRERLARKYPTPEYPTIVEMVEYTWCKPLRIPKLDKARFDLALIDGPHGTQSRPPVLAWCLKRCDLVLIPTEDGDGGLMRTAIRAEAKKARRSSVQWMETGPLSGGFALIS